MILLSPQKPTATSFAEQAQTRFGDQSKQFLKLYPAETDTEALQSAMALASDDFIAFSTWKWIDTKAKGACRFMNTTSNRCRKQSRGQ